MALRGFAVVGRSCRAGGGCGGEAVGEEWHYRESEGGRRASSGFCDKLGGFVFVRSVYICF